MKNLLIAFILLSTIIFNSNAECVDPSLIDPNSACPFIYTPVCGCDGKTYPNSCVATAEGGITIYSHGSCSPTESYTICPGQSVEIGQSFWIPNTFLTWNPSTDLSCTNCPNPIASPAVTTTYELTTFTTIDFTTEYTYYEVIVDENCDCEEGVFPEGTYINSIGTDDVPQSYAAAFYSWTDVHWTDDLCSWFWDFGTGETSTDANPQGVEFLLIDNTIPVTEPYNICLTVKDCNDQIVTNCCEDFYPLGIPVCSLPPDTGPCDGICERWYYNHNEGDCLQFQWGCCEGNANNFETYDLCINACQPPCIDTSLVDPGGFCADIYNPVCGCNGKTYANTCTAEITDGVSNYTSGPCPPTETYTICEGQSVEIGYPFWMPNTILTWNPTTDLSCTNCPNPIASPSVTTTYELTIFTTIGLTTDYVYFEVIVEEECPCDDTNNLPWLQLPTCDNCYSKVEVIEYDNQTLIAFWADHSACNDAITIIYNCDGTVYCYQDGFAGFQQCTDLIASYTVLETLWNKNIDCSNDCPPILNLGTAPLNTANYQAQQIIYGGNINPNQQVKFRASTRITIKNGFAVPAASEFKVEIGECN